MSDWLRVIPESDMLVRQGVNISSSSMRIMKAVFGVLELELTKVVNAGYLFEPLSSASPLGREE